MLRFEDLLCFYLQLLAGLTLLCCLLTWVQLLADLALAGVGSLSHLQVGVGLLWLEHTLWAFACGHLCLLLVGLRVSCRVPLELGWVL